MQFICLVYLSDDATSGFSKEDHAELDRSNLAYDASLQRQGHFVSSAALASTSAAVTVRKRNGLICATDGPFAETKEHLGGFIIVEARDRAEALALVSRDPMIELGSVEIRPIMNIAEPGFADWAAETYGRP